MLSLTEWLTRVGFEAGNPFELKQADEEGDWLQQYFVEHPAYTAMLDNYTPRSSILDAPRGAGKSSTRRMFEHFCLEHRARLKPLLVYLLDWMPIYERVAPLDGPSSLLFSRAYLPELFAQVVLALAREQRQRQLASAPGTNEMVGYLQWLCLYYGSYLTATQRALLRRLGWLPAEGDSDLSDYDLHTQHAVRSLHLLVQTVQALGYQTCYILVDRVDEMADTVNNADYVARLLTPLIGNLAINEMPGLVWKYFVPSDAIAVLRHENTLRDDRINCVSLSWDDVSLKELLQARLAAFSAGRITSLAPLVTRGMRDIDERLCQAAAGSPRRLLNLGERLIKLTANDASEHQLLIQRHHLDAAIALLRAETSPSSAVAAAPTLSEAESVEEAATDPPDPPPPLGLYADGSIRRGNDEIEGWWNLPALQRRFVEYLYQQRGKLCLHDEIVAYVWKDIPPPTDAGSLRKLAERVIKFIEIDPERPVYIHKVRGGHYRLDNTHN